MVILGPFLVFTPNWFIKVFEILGRKGGFIFVKIRKYYFCAFFKDCRMEF